ncbi:hypothetical protein MKW98_018852 [Papaver atlanticum]|uniref:Uncharacterized protein n=1 Tax=Papaver atlanticum TaxID=357466 RepID=A0AAD4TJW6_9MAGN|nr:hypothetical protein MKW98_018852 [Papaver atlanticum]
MDMINERKRKRRHDLDPHERAHELQQRQILERAKQSSILKMHFVLAFWPSLTENAMAL